MDHLDPLERWARKVMARRDVRFKMTRVVDRGYFYTKDKPRSITILGERDGKPAVFRAYDDPRPCEEANAQLLFNYLLRPNGSGIVTPTLLWYSHMSLHKGALVQDRMPLECTALRDRKYRTPLSDDERQLFLSRYVRYRSALALKDWRPMSKFERSVLPKHLRGREQEPEAFYRTRFRRWRLRAEASQLTVRADTRPWADPRRVRAALSAGVDAVLAVFQGEENEWGHHHVTAAQLFSDWRRPAEDAPLYLINFRHVSRRPRGYDATFATVWADVLMTQGALASLPDLKRRIGSWVEDIDRAFGESEADNPLPRGLVDAAILERTLGVFMMDVTASDEPVASKRQKVAVLLPFIEELINRMGGTR